MTTTQKKIKAQRSDDPWIEDFEVPSLRIPSCLYNFNQPAYILGLITVLFYVFLSIYYVSFFNRLSLPFYTLNLPLSFYIFAAGIFISNILYIIFPLVLVLAGYYSFIVLGQKVLAYENIDNHYKNNSIDKLLGMLGLFMIIILSIIGAFILLTAYAPHSLQENIFNILNEFLTPLNSLLVSLSFTFPKIASIDFITILILSAILFVPLTVSILGLIIIKNEKKISYKMVYLKEIYLDNLVVIRSAFILIGVLSLISITSIIFYVPLMLGNYAAEDLISGRTDHIEMNISMLDKNASSLFDKTLIFVTECNGNYYLIERNNRVLSNTSSYLYVIPETKVQSATLKSVKASIDHIS